MRMRLVAEQLRSFSAEPEDLADRLLVVARIIVVATIHPHAPALLPQVASRRVAEERLHRRAGIGEHPFPGQAAIPGRLRCTGAHRLRHSAQIRFAVECQDVSFFVCQQVLAEHRVECCETLIDLLETSLVALGQRGAAALEPLEVNFRQTALLRRQPGCGARLIDGFQPTEEPRILDHLVIERRQNRRHFRLERLHVLVIEVGPVDTEEAQRATQLAPGVLEWLHCVGERGTHFECGERLNVRPDQVHRPHQCRLEALYFDQIEARQAAVRSGPGRQHCVQRRRRHRCDPLIHSDGRGTRTTSNSGSNRRADDKFSSLHEGRLRKLRVGANYTGPAVGENCIRRSDRQESPSQPPASGL